MRKLCERCPSPSSEKKASATHIFPKLRVSESWLLGRVHTTSDKPFLKDCVVYELPTDKAAMRKKFSRSQSRSLPSPSSSSSIALFHYSLGGAVGAALALLALIYDRVMQRQKKRRAEEEPFPSLISHPKQRILLSPSDISGGSMVQSRRKERPWRCTELFIHMFCYVFLFELRGPA